MSASNKPIRVATGQLIASGILPPRLTPFMRGLRDALAVMAQGIKPKLAQPQAVYNAGYPDRFCATDRVAVVIDDICDTLARESAMSKAQQLEQALALPRTMEAHIRARFAGVPSLSLTEHYLRASRVDASDNMTMAEAIAHPSDASINLRAAEMAEHEAREKLGLAAQIRAFFGRTSHRGSAA